MMKVIAAGGGGASDSRLIDELFVGLTGNEKKTLYIPIALDGAERPYQDCFIWMKSVYEPLGLKDIQLCVDMNQASNFDMTKYSAVYIGGGNTFKLLKTFKETGFDIILREFILNGGIVYGGSAGAIILGKDIMTCAHLDTNDVGLDNFSGIDCFNGYSIWCHYELENDALINTYINMNHFPVVAIPEKSGVLFDGSNIRVFGYTPCYVFDGNKKKPIMPEL